MYEELKAMIRGLEEYEEATGKVSGQLVILEETLTQHRYVTYEALLKSIKGLIEWVDEPCSCGQKPHTDNCRKSLDVLLAAQAAVKAAEEVRE